jgi:hypothetical protein
MHRPANPTPTEELRLDLLEDVAAAALRKAIAGEDRIAIETFCFSLARRLAAAPLDGDDRDEIRATIGLIADRVQFGIHQRLRKFLLPLATAIELQIEAAEKDVV